jgi:flap endonuclease-1
MTIARLNDFFKPIPKTKEEIEAMKKKNEQKAAEKKRKAKETAAAKKGGKKPKLGS